MQRRLFFFGFGFLISIIILSFGPENRLKNTFYSYIDYFDMDKRVITHLKNDSTVFTIQSECQLVYYGIQKKDLLLVLEGGDVNFEESEKDSKPCQYYVIENRIKNNNFSVTFEYCYSLDKVRVIKFTVDDEDEVCNG